MTGFQILPPMLSPTWAKRYSRLSEYCLDTNGPDPPEDSGEPSAPKEKKRNAVIAYTMTTNITKPIKNYPICNRKMTSGIGESRYSCAPSPIIFVVIHVYWYCYQAITNLGGEHRCRGPHTAELQRTAGLFKNLLSPKVFALIFLALVMPRYQGCQKIKKMTWEKKLRVPHIRTRAFFMNWWMLSLPHLSPDGECGVIHPTFHDRIYTAAHGRNMDEPTCSATTSWTMCFNTGQQASCRRRISLENEYSVNLPTKFVYPGREWDGWINVVNPFRASISPRYTGFRGKPRCGEQLYQTTDFRGSRYTYTVRQSGVVS